jgi:hypothetical protein
MKKQLRPNQTENKTSWDYQTVRFGIWRLDLATSPTNQSTAENHSNKLKKKVDKLWQEKNFVVISFVLWAENLR